MRRVIKLTRSTVGQKVVMAVTGTLLFGFVLGHMAGNLKLYQGEAAYNAYAEHLRELGEPILGHGQALWIARLVLLAAVGAHIAAAVALTRRSRRARPDRYKQLAPLSFSYASRTMRWGGVIIAAFVVYHLLHLTLGTVHHDFEHGSVYRNVVSGFEVWWVSLAYIVAMVPLGLHLYHGLWSATQTLALRNPRVVAWRRPLAVAITLAIVLGNISMPVAVLVGIVR